MSTSDPLIAVTGATGLVGKAFTRAALDQGYRLRLLKRRTGEAALPVGCEEVAFDLGDAALAPEAVKGCAALVHLAAYIPPSMADPGEAERCFSMNALATLRLLEAGEKAGVGAFVHTCSANAYAATATCPDEEAPQYPVHRGTYYLTSKLAQDLFAAHWALGHDIRVACLRLSSVYGPDQSKGALVAMTRALLAGQPVTLQNAGRFGADFVHSDDVATSLIASLKTQASGAFNIGSGQRSSMAQIADILIRLCQADPSLLIVEKEVSASDVGFPALDIEKARHELGFDPVQLEIGLEGLVHAMRTCSESPLTNANLPR